MKTSSKENNFPLEHLSESSVSLLERDQRSWIQKYIYGNVEHTTAYMQFGRDMADFFDDDTLIECVLKRGKQTLKVIGLLDGVKGDTQRENKTAVKPWTQKMCDQSLQLKTYALIHYKNKGKVPKQILTWRGTKMVDGKLELTGESKEFHVKQTMRDLLETEARYWTAFDRICELTAKEYSKI